MTDFTRKIIIFMGVVAALCLGCSLAKNNPKVENKDGDKDNDKEAVSLNNE